MAISPGGCGPDPRTLTMIVGGQYRAGAWDGVELEPDFGAALWQGPEPGLAIIDILIDVLACPCVSARAYVWDGKGWNRPWMTWVADNAPSPLPYPFPFAGAPEPARQTRHRDGELRIWP